MPDDRGRSLDRRRRSRRRVGPSRRSTRTGARARPLRQRARVRRSRRRRLVPLQQRPRVFIDPGSPWQNAWIESFNGKFGDELLNVWQFDSLLEARAPIEDWRIDSTGSGPTPPTATSPQARSPPSGPPTHPKPNNTWTTHRVPLRMPTQPIRSIGDNRCGHQRRVRGGGSRRCCTSAMLSSSARMRIRGSVGSVGTRTTPGMGSSSPGRSPRPTRRRWMPSRHVASSSVGRCATISDRGCKPPHNTADGPVVHGTWPAGPGTSPGAAICRLVQARRQPPAGSVVARKGPSDAPGG